VNRELIYRSVSPYLVTHCKEMMMTIYFLTKCVSVRENLRISGISCMECKFTDFYEAINFKFDLCVVE